MKIIFPNDKFNKKYTVYAANLSEPLNTIYIHMPGEYDGLMPIGIKEVIVADDFLDDSYSIELRDDEYSMLLHWTIKNSAFLIELVERRQESYDKFLKLIQMTYKEYLRGVL